MRLISVAVPFVRLTDLIIGKRKAEDDASTSPKKVKLDANDQSTQKSEGASKEDSKLCFIGRLSWNVDNDWLAQEFAEFGEVISARVQMDRNSGKSRGFGFVEFATVEAANAAVAQSGIKDIDGRQVNIDKTLPKASDPEKRAKVFGDVASAPSSVLFVGNVSFNTTEDRLWEIFAEYGEVKRVSLPTDKDTQRPKGFGYVEFLDIETAKKAFEGAKGSEVDGRALRLDYSQPRSDSGDAAGRRKGPFNKDRGWVS